MAKLLNESKFRYLGLNIKTSSHLTCFAEKAAFLRAKNAQKEFKIQIEEKLKARQRFEEYFPIGSEIKAWGGLILAKDDYGLQPLSRLVKPPYKRDSKVIQVEEFENFLKYSKCKVSLQVTTANDFKVFLVKEGQMLPVSPQSEERWSQLSNEQKCGFSIKKSRFLSKDSRDFIQEKVETYVSYLKKLYQLSHAKFVFHSSLLERSYPKIKIFRNLELYFCHLNDMIRREINSLNQGEGVNNVDGERIEWFFIDVSHHFFKETEKIKLFTFTDQKKKTLVHRNEKELKLIVDSYLQHIHQKLAERGVI